mgnify:CR=1 FL=1
MAAEQMDRFPRIRTAYGSLTKAEKRIADYIVQHMEHLVECTISEVAEDTGTSEITVSRFCKKLGCSGWQSLKIAVAVEQSAEGGAESTDIHVDDSFESITAKIFRNITDGLQDTLKLLDYAAIERAVDLIRAARRIAVYGFGNSATVCRDIETRFLRFGMVVQAYSDAHQQATSASLLTARDVVIAVSHTGATLELLDTVRTAREAGASVIVITSHVNSPLAKLGDVVLHGMGREVHYSSEAVSSRLIHMAITDALYTVIAMRAPQDYRRNLQKMREVIAKKRT